MTEPRNGGPPGGPRSDGPRSDDPPPTEDADAPAADSGPTADDAAAAALIRARAAAREKGLRPGLRPLRQRRIGIPGESPRGRDGRDPGLLGDQMDRMVSDRGWKVDVAIGAVMGRWPAIVGPEVAQHCVPVTYEAGVLTIRADSTAWATQIRLLTSAILARLDGEVGPGTVTELTVHGPSAPSWSRGFRRSTGPGPRDTYG